MRYFRVAPTWINNLKTQFRKETKNMKKVDIICYLFFLLFLYSAIDKIYDYENFRVQLGQSPLLTNFAGYVAWLVPSIEIVIAIMLVIPKTVLSGLFASFSLMVMFTAYIIVIMNYSEYIPCSCNGILEGASWKQHLAFNIFFVLLAVGGIVLHTRPYNQDKPA